VAHFEEQNERSGCDGDAFSSVNKWKVFSPNCLLRRSLGRLGITDRWGKRGDFPDFQKNFLLLTSISAGNYDE
jgi:hypothetical protein